MRRSSWLSLVLCLLTLGMAGCSGSPPDNLGVVNGRLAPCPDTPNCVSSQEDDDVHGMEPIEHDGSMEEAQALIREILEEMPRVTVVHEQPGYIRAEARSRIFRFVDDLEFYFDPEAGQIHYRSAARLGRSDLGVNRDRMVRILDEFYRRAPSLQE